MTTANAKLNMQQRAYLKDELIKRFVKKMNEKYRKNAPAILSDGPTGRDYNGQSYHYYVQLRYRLQSGRYDEPSHIVLTKGGELDPQTCFNLDDTAKAKAEHATLPDSWYFEQYEAGHYKLEAEMQQCMSRPKLKCVFPNEKRALGKLRTGYKTRWKNAYKKQAENLSEARLDVMEFNKWMEDVANPQIMLSSGDAKLFESLLKSALAL